MLTFRQHEPIVDREKNTISVWNDEKNAYEVYSWEFIQYLSEMIEYEIVYES